jgi:hypothetical protein
MVFVHERGDIGEHGVNFTLNDCMGLMIALNSNNIMKNNKITDLLGHAMIPAGFIFDGTL